MAVLHDARGREKRRNKSDGDKAEWQSRRRKDECEGGSQGRRHTVHKAARSFEDVHHDTTSSS